MLLQQLLEVLILFYNIFLNIIFNKGAGSAAVRLAKYIGANVIAIVGSDSKGEIVKKIGADHVINYKKEDITN